MLRVKNSYHSIIISHMSIEIRFTVPLNATTILFHLNLYINFACLFVCCKTKGQNGWPIGPWKSQDLEREIVLEDQNFINPQKICKIILVLFMMYDLRRDTAHK